ncbi:MAG: MBL fold metallo-hydrolase [Candidatus Nanoarchaeia archaeon]
MSKETEEVKKIGRVKAEKISDLVYKFAGSSNCYLIEIDEYIMIDCGHERDKEDLKKAIEEIVPVEKVDKVIFTHLHYDHAGNFELFSNARFFASKGAIESLQWDAYKTVLEKNIAEKLQKFEINPVESNERLKVIETPGHTKGSICLYLPEEKILFSGDTVFHKAYGRIDLPTSNPVEMKKSLEKIGELDFEKLCPGHEI